MWTPDLFTLGRGFFFGSSRPYTPLRLRYLGSLIVVEMQFVPQAAY